MIHTRMIVGLLMILSLAGCGVGGGIADGPPQSNNLPLEEYEIGVGDTLQINVWKNPELSVNVPVRPDGKISMPLVGDIVAAGNSAPQLAQNITDELKSYVRSPQVTVIVANAGSVDFQRRVRITGAVQNPLSLPHRDGMTVLDLVLEAGGPTEFASPDNAKLYRKVDGEVKVYPVHLDDLLQKGKLNTNYRLAPSDIITVPERIF